MRCRHGRRGPRYRRRSIAHGAVPRREPGLPRCRPQTPHLSLRKDTGRRGTRPSRQPRCAPGQSAVCSLEAMGNPDSFYADDELHLSSEGYTYWEEWAGLALATPECPMWEGGTCSCEDDESWHFAGKPGKTCEYVRAAAARRDEPTSTISPTTQTTLTPTANHQRSRPNLFPFPFFPTLPLAASPSLIHFQPLS